MTSGRPGKPRHGRDCVCASLLEGVVRELACGHAFHQRCVDKMIESYKQEVNWSRNWQPTSVAELTDPQRPAANWRQIPKPQCPYCRTRIRKKEGVTYTEYVNQYVNTEVPDDIVGEEREKKLRSIEKKKRRNQKRAERRWGRKTGGPSEQRAHEE